MYFLIVLIIIIANITEIVTERSIDALKDANIATIVIRLKTVTLSHEPKNIKVILVLNMTNASYE